GPPHGAPMEGNAIQRGIGVKVVRTSRRATCQAECHTGRGDYLQEHLSHIGCLFWDLRADLRCETADNLFVSEHVHAYQSFWVEPMKPNPCEPCKRKVAKKFRYCNREE